MVEVRAASWQISACFAAHLLRIAGGPITEWRMADASQLRAPGG
jgi:hypothetical protein